MLPVSQFFSRAKRGGSAGRVGAKLGGDGPELGTGTGGGAPACPARGAELGDPGRGGTPCLPFSGGSNTGTLPAAATPGCWDLPVGTVTLGGRERGTG